MIEVEIPKTLKDKKAAATAACKQINADEDLGPGSVFNLGDKVGIPWPHIETGINSVDYDVLQIGGLPRGRIIEVFGPESSGKTTFSLQCIANAQSQGGLGAVVDVENALDPTWASTLGVDVDNLTVSQPDNGEQALSIVEILVASNAYDIIVVDSVAALVPQKELEGDFGDAQMGTQARLMSQAMRKLSSVVRRSGCVLIFINQIREKLGVTYGSNETTTGGRALKFYASVRLDVRKVQQIKRGEEIIGNLVKIKAVKNKLAAPFKLSEVDLLFDRGFDKTADLIDVAVELGVIKKDGTSFIYGTERMGVGAFKASEWVLTNGKFEEIKKKVMEKRNDRTGA